MATDSLGQLTVDLIANTGGFEAGMDRVQRSLKSATKEAEYQAGQLDRLVGQIDPVVGAYGRLDKMEEQLRAHRKAGRLDVDDFNDYLKKLNEQRLAVEKTDSVVRKSGVTAAQTTSAFRQLPAQISDIFTSLAGGQNPLLVLIQQGGQIKDSFGGVGATFEAFSAKLKGAFSGAGTGAGAIDAVGAALSGVGAGAKAAGEGAQAAGESLGNMAEGANTAADAAKNAKDAAGVLSAGVGGVSVGLLATVGAAAAAAAAIGVVIYGYIEGSKEADAYRQTIIQTGNSAGVTTGILAAMAETVGASTGKIGLAADALNQLAGDGKIARASFEEIASAAIATQTATGKAVSETVAEFSKIADDPVAAAKKLNDQYNFLTASVYQQIVALKEQDKEQEAATLLTDKYAEVVKSRASEVIKDLGYVESAWKAVKAVTSGAIDDVKNFGREQTIQSQIAQLDKQLDSMKSIEASAQKQIGLDDEQLKKYREMAGYDAEKVKSWTVQKGFLQGQLDTQQAISAAQGNYAEQQRKSIDALSSIHKDYLAGLDKEAQKKKKIEDLDRNREDALKGKNVNVAQINKEYDVALKDINEKFKEKVSPGAVDLTGFNDAENKLKSLVASYENSFRILDAQERAGLISADDYALQKGALLEKEKGDVESAYQAEIAALQAVSDKSSTTGAQRIGVDQKIADARQKMVDALKKLDADQEILSQQTSARNARDQAALKAFSQNVQDSLSLAQQGLDNQLAGIGLGSEARQRLQDDLKIRQDYQKQVERLSRDYANIVNPSLGQKDNYNKETQILKDALEQRLSAQRDYYSKLQGFQADWTNGARAALQDYIVEAGNIAGQTEHLFSDALHGVEDVFVDLATTGKLSFKSLADSIIADLARIIAKTLIVQPLISALFGGGGGGGGVAALGGLAAIFGSSGSSGSSASTSGGTSIGSLANSASSAYSIVTGVGPAASAGYTSGGVVGAVKGVASYYGNITSSAVSTIAGSASQIAAALTGQTAAYGATQGAYTGSAYASWVASQGASQGAASAGGSAAGGAALWPLAIIMGMYQSGKLYDAGLRYDKGEIEGSDLSKLGDKLGTAGLDRKLAFESIGLADKVASKLFGGKIGAMLSGSTFAMSVENMISSKLFGTGYQTKDSGLSLQVNNGDLDAQSYIDQKKKGGLLSGKSKSRTLYSALDDDQATQLQGLYAATQLGVVDLVKQIGITVEDGAFDAMKVAELKISTQGKTEDEIQAAVSGWFSYASDVMVATLDKGVNGFGYSFTELARRINVFTGFNAQLDVIDVKMFKLSASSMELANSLVEAAGGTDAMTANINTYYDKFFSDSEKTSDALAAVQKQFSDMGVSLPVTRDAYRAMVSAIDLTTDAGQQLFLKLTSAAGAAASAYDILESRTQAATAAAFSALQRSVTAQQKSTTDAYNAQVTSINDMASAASKSVTDMTAISTSLANALKALNGTSDDAVKMLRAQARATLESALATARSGGSLAGFDGLDDALSAVSSNNTDLYSSLEEFNRDQGRTANVVAELNDLNGKQLSSAEEMVKNLQDQLKLAADSYKLQMDALQAQLDYGQAQLDALNGVDTSVKTVAAAVAAMNAAVVAALATLPRTGAGSAMANTPENNSTLIDSIYQTVLGRDTSNDAGGAAYWAQLLNSGALTYDQAAAAIANSAVSGGGTAADAANAGKYLGLPGYAKGTNSWDGSPALVGEFGPEIVSANSLGAATIYPAQRSRSLLGAGGEESSQAANDTQSFREKIVKKVNEIARAVSFLDIWNSDGLPATRV